MQKKLAIVIVLLISLIVSCSPKGYQVPKPPSAKISATRLQVTGKSEAFIEETQLLSLSLDGKWLFGQKLESICIYEAATLTEKVCVPWKSTLDPKTIAWSPDSQQVAFTENLDSLTESDLWVLKIATGTLSDLTNDGLDGDLTTALQRAKAETKTMSLDSLPAWSPDGKTLSFIRSLYGDIKQTYLCTIPAAGGKVTKLIIADDEQALAVWHGMRWTPDGKKILFTINVLEDDSGKNGIWIVDKDGKNFKQLAGEKEGWGYVALYDLSAKGDKALIGYPRAITFSSNNPNLCFFELLDLTTGEITPIMGGTTGDALTGAPRDYFSPTQAVFSPDGSKILYHYNLGSKDQLTPQLVVQDVIGNNAEVLGDWSIYSGADVGSSLFWAANDTIYIISGPGAGTLYQLSSK